ncbi:MAG: hypothetical protein PHD56_07720 [Anaerostipes sp.]|nr:hypothetical protein [Anaerostipes sp.]
MSSYSTLNVIEKEYTGEKREKDMVFSFPEVPYRGVQVMPDHESEESEPAVLKVSARSEWGTN